MLRAAQSRNNNDGNRFVSVTSERDLAAVGRPGWTAVAGIARQAERFLAPNQRRIDSGVVCAIARERPVPLLFVGVGEDIDDLRPFVAREFAEALVG